MRPRIAFLAVASMAAFSAPAFARECPTHVKKIDAALASANLSQEQKAEVMRLRDDGQKLHGEGKHEESMETLGRAEKMLGIM
jgi:hypothetical protein